MTAAWQKETVRKPRGSWRKKKYMWRGRQNKKGSKRQIEKATDGQTDSE